MLIRDLVVVPYSPVITPQHPANHPFRWQPRSHITTFNLKARLKPRSTHAIFNLQAELPLTAPSFICEQTTFATNPANLAPSEPRFHSHHPTALPSHGVRHGLFLCTCDVTPTPRHGAKKESKLFSRVPGFHIPECFSKSTPVSAEAH